MSKGCKVHYNEPKMVDMVFIISLFHSVKLESLFQNRKHPPLKQKNWGFEKKASFENPTYYYILKCNLKFINVWISRIKFNS